MSRLPPLLALALLGAAFAAGGANAGDECIGGSKPEIDLGATPAGHFYVDNDVIVGGVSTWVYQETNGVAGLQRDDHIHDDTCGGMMPADTRIAMLYAAPL